MSPALQIWPSARQCRRHVCLRQTAPAPELNVRHPEDIRHTLCYIIVVKYFSWNPEKNASLIEDRGISFEEVVFHIEQEDVLDLLEHPDKQRYPNQRIFIVNVEGYAYLVPFVEDESEVFLKTIIPSRKATRDYLGGPE